MKTMTCDTYTVKIYMAGDINHAKQLLRAECYPPNEGLCVTVEPTTFIYSGGYEEGFVVGFVNYPRFPKHSNEIYARAKLIAAKLMTALSQWSAMLVTPQMTEWLTCRPEEQK